MRLLDFFDGAQSETAPTIGNLLASGLITYPDDATYEATEQGAPAEGNVYFNTTTKFIRYYNGTSWIDLVDDESVQTLVNKSIDADNNPITNLEDDNIKAGAGIDATKLAGGTVDNTEFGYLDGVTSGIQSQLDAKIPSSEKGAANGVATLDGSGLVPAGQLPSYVDDVLEYADFASFPGTGETGKIYIALDTNRTYRWSGTIYIDITGAVDSVNGQTGTVSLSIDDLTDVDTTTTPPSTDNVLAWDGSNWVPAAPASGGDVLAYEVKVTSYSVQTTDYALGFTTGASNLTATLPDATTTDVGKIFEFKKLDSGTGSLIIDGSGAQTIDGSTTFELHKQHNHIKIQNTGSEWLILSKDVADYREITLDSRPGSTTANTYVDSTETLTLGAGTWDIGYSVLLRMNNDTGALTGGTTNVRVYDDTNLSAVSNTGSTLYHSLATAEEIAVMLSNKTEITITQDTDYIVQVATAITNVSVILEDSDFTGGITGSETSPKLWARRVG